MRSARAIVEGVTSRRIARVTSVDRLATEWQPELSWLVSVTSVTELEVLQRFERAGVCGLHALVPDTGLVADCGLPVVTTSISALDAGDVVALTPGAREVHVLYRELDAHHTVFLTNRCNSYCLMCSQPPSERDDSWLIDEAVTVAAHIRVSPAVLGFSGGEPLLLGPRLRKVLDAYRRWHPSTALEVLTNGRRLTNAGLARELLDGLSRVTWMVPLYGHADFLHDFVVQTHGAFGETLDGLLTLQEYAQPIQLRVVLIKPVLEVLPHLCEFVAKNLPFVREVALMGCEPVGFALANREQCEVDIADWHTELAAGVRRLIRGRVPVALMNLPLCGLPAALRPFAHRSISDWKQVYATECDTCAVRAECCGLFASHNRAWCPTQLRPIEEMA
jgi:His-Xaa-Ser system radical SAM maturase HxsC